MTEFTPQTAYYTIFAIWLAWTTFRLAREAWKRANEAADDYRRACERMTRKYGDRAWRVGR